MGLGIVKKQDSLGKGLKLKYWNSKLPKGLMLLV